MPQLVLAALLLSLTLGADQASVTTVVEVVKSRGLPSFAAKSAHAQAGRLEVTDFDSVRPRREAGQLKGSVLIYCDPQDVLRFWVARVHWAMQQAAPTAGHEGEGRSLPEMMDRSKRAVERLDRPVRVVLLFVDADGNVTRTETVRVKEVQFAGPPA